jgi:hypothetical protein
MGRKPFRGASMLRQSIRLAISTLDKVHPAVADDGPESSVVANSALGV